MYTLANNKCKWLVYRTINKCNKNCVGNYCALHNGRIKIGMKTFPCYLCGIGISHLGVCCICKNILVKVSKTPW